MKKLLIVAGMAGLLSMGSCSKDHATAMTVVRNCTGTYLRTEEGKTYHVCNLERLAAYPDGAAVKAFFRETDACAAAEGLSRCKMFFPSEGWIEVTTVR